MTSDQPDTPPEEGITSLKEAVRPSLGTRLRAYLLTGTVIGAPIMITLYLTSALIGFLDHLVTRWIPDRYNPETYLPFSVPGFGILIMLIGLVLLGAAAANLFGRGVINYGERLVHRVPIIRTVYNGLKQIIETIVSQSGGASLRQVGLVEYPRKGQWVVVFVTNDAPPEISARLGQDMVAVFRSTTPNAAHGFLMFVPRADVIMLDMRAEDAAKLVMSGGIAAPGVVAPPAAGNAPQAVRK
jgi:uncharacterized membrane protein